jgi:hypothetical protein
MTKRTTTQITIQTRQAIVVRSLPESFQAWCGRCGEVVLALTRESVTGLLQIPASSLAELVDGGSLHTVQVGAESSMICCNSLSNGVTQTQIQIEGERQ